MTVRLNNYRDACLAAVHQKLCQAVSQVVYKDACQAVYQQACQAYISGCFGCCTVGCILSHMTICMVGCMCAKAAIVQKLLACNF